MEHDSLNPTTNQLLIQHFSEAAVFTDPGFAITACNSAASALFHYNQQDLPGHSISFLVPASSTTNSQLSIVNTTFTEGIIEYIDSNGKIIQLHTTRHAIAPGLPNGGYLFIYKPLHADHPPTGSYAQLRELSDHLLNIRETERTKIAREIHDELGQQEALTNIARHANAKTVFSKLQWENGLVILTIADDGAGFDMQTLAIKKTLGLLGMKERTLMMGGRFEINNLMMLLN